MLQDRNVGVELIVGEGARKIFTKVEAVAESSFEVTLFAKRNPLFGDTECQSLWI